MVLHKQSLLFTVFQSLFWAGALFCSITSYSQKKYGIDTAQIYKATEKIKITTPNPIQLAQKICKPYSDEASKVLALSYWVANNIQYDYQSYKKRSISQKKSSQVLQTKKALCGEYAQLFKEMCKAVGVEAEVVTGYTQGFDFFDSDTLYRSEHAWSVVKVNGHWKLMDLTLASGGVVAKKQFFKKFLANTFSIKYCPQFKFVPKFNPQWLYVEPDEMILTHFPNLKMYQLLQVPVPMDTYTEGSWAVYQHLAWHFKTLKRSESIDAYIEKGQIEKWLQEAEEGHRNNPNNHRIKGFNYYLVLDSIFRASFDKETACIIQSPEILKQLSLYATVADSMLALSIEDNYKEFRWKEWQSKWWKQRLFDYNKNHLTNFDMRCNLNLNQEQLVKKIEKENKHYQQFALQSAHYYHQKTHFNPRLTEKEKIKNYFETLDSLQELAKKALAQKDSFMQFYKTEATEKICAKERLVLDIHKGNCKALQKRHKEKMLDLPMVYYDTKNLDNEWLQNSHYRADSINRVITNTFLASLLTNQKASYDLIRQYFEAVGAQVQLIQKAKNKAACKEKKYIDALSKLEKQLKNYHTELENSLHFQQKILLLLEKEIKFMHCSAKTLSDEDELEQYRHQNYLAYRKFILNTENAKIQSLRQKIANIQNFIKGS